MIRELGETISNTVVESFGRAVGRTQEQRPLPADMLENDESYLVVFDAPGVEAGDAQVRFEDHTLSVRLDRFRDFHEGYDMRFPGRGLALDGEVTLPDDASVDPSGASATLRDNGTLQVEIPKVETAEETETTDDTESVDEADSEESTEDADATDDSDESDETAN